MLTAYLISTTHQCEEQVDTTHQVPVDKEEILLIKKHFCKQSEILNQDYPSQVEFIFLICKVLIIFYKILFFSCKFVVDYNEEKYLVHAVDPDLLVEWDTVQLVVCHKFYWDILSCRHFYTECINIITHFGVYLLIFFCNFSTFLHTRIQNVQSACIHQLLPRWQNVDTFIAGVVSYIIWV